MLVVEIERKFLDLLKDLGAHLQEDFLSNAHHNAKLDHVRQPNQRLA